MRSTLIPAPELDLARVGHLRARARRGPDAPAGSPVTLPDPLTAMDICGRPILQVQGLSGPEQWTATPPLRVPDGLVWCFYGVGDLSHHDHLAGLRLRVEIPAKKGPSITRVTEDWEINLLHLGQRIDLPQDYRQPRLGYLEPPVWIHGGTRFWFEFLGSGFFPSDVAAITLLGYSGTGLA